jgi:hypothetical protein
MKKLTNTEIQHIRQSDVFLTKNLVAWWPLQKKSVMKKLIIIIFFLFAITAHAKTVQDFIDEGQTLKNMEKGFIELPRSFLTTVIPKNFPLSEICDKDCRQMTVAEYCAGGFLENEETDTMLITLDRCGYQDGQNRRYPPSESDINLFLDYFGGTAVLLKEPGLLIRENYLEEIL